MRPLTRTPAILASLLLLTAGSVRASSEIELRPDPDCAVDADVSEEILALADRIARSWEAGEAMELAGIVVGGGISTPDRPRLETVSEIEAAISEQVNRSIFQGSRLEIVLRCLRREEDVPDAIAVEGSWRITRFYGQDNPAGGNPMPRHLMPPTAGAFVAGVTERDGEWSVVDLGLAFEPPG